MYSVLIVVRYTVPHAIINIWRCLYQLTEVAGDEDVGVGVVTTV